MSYLRLVARGHLLHGAGSLICSRMIPNRHDDGELTIKPFHPVPERMRSPMILAFVRKTMSQKIVVTP
jgi:hypothetical protein